MLLLLLRRRVRFLLPSSLSSPRAPLAKPLPLPLRHPPRILASAARPLASMAAPAAMSRDAFRAAVTNTLERRLFFVPSFKIYGGVAGLYDYGPPGCAVKANVLNILPLNLPIDLSLILNYCGKNMPRGFQC